MSVGRFKFRCNILISGKIIKEMSGSVASGTLFIFKNVLLKSVRFFLMRILRVVFAVPWMDYRPVAG